jgi:hypothetical protein
LRSIHAEIGGNGERRLRLDCGHGVGKLRQGNLGDDVFVRTIPLGWDCRGFDARTWLVREHGEGD